MNALSHCATVLAGVAACALLFMLVVSLPWR